jgi:hypothetical protein
MRQGYGSTSEFIIPTAVTLIEMVGCKTTDKIQISGMVCNSITLKVLHVDIDTS